ncbi:hypothetical protein BN1723_020939, partial [Verticillium longisporum]
LHLVGEPQGFRGQERF